MKKFVFSMVVASVVILSGCTRIETGEVGLRVDASKQIQGTELLPGSFNQTMIGDVLTFPVRDIVMTLENKTPMTSDNSSLQDFDMNVIYTINPSSVSDLWSTKSRSFHMYGERSGDWYLMYNYVQQLANNAAYKAVRKYNALTIADNRQNIESDVRLLINEELKEQKLDSALNITTVQVRNILPAQSILDSANSYVKAQNELRIKSTEVDIAKKEAERMEALARNSGQSIAYMQAQAQMKIAEGIAEGKVNTIVVPMDFKGMINVK